MINIDEVRVDLQEYSKDELIQIVQRRLKIKLKNVFHKSRWDEVDKSELENYLLEICEFNQIDAWDIMNLKMILYFNQDNFLIEKHLGKIRYYSAILNKALLKYGSGNSIDFKELLKIVSEILSYIDTAKFENAIESPVYICSDYLDDIIRVLRALLTESKNEKSDMKYLIDNFRMGLENANENFINNLMSS
ncbi:MAG: hypothetical protein INQ03_13925 [Candidatus Heimdallarchaeota archaeon]|nr:hypothetical protein [Candidatus Heimdallarchaeota archaeon]